MPGHDIVVIGASAGGIEAVRKIVQQLPPDLPAALFVVLHIPAESPSLLPEVIGMVSPLPAVHPTHGGPIKTGRIYVAPPDHHLLIVRNHVHIVRGPRENSFRPAIDALFRTAARAYGPRVIGVILTGMLDDGTAGLLAVKRRGGCAIVQDPEEALYPSMPQSALRYVAVDAVLPLREIAREIVRRVHEPVTEEEYASMDDALNLESDISDLDPAALQQADQLGTPSSFACPDCGGVLVEYYDGDLLRFRCQVGHVYSQESLLSQHAVVTDGALWAAFRSLDERVNLLRRLAHEAQRQGDLTGIRRFGNLATAAEERKQQIYQALAKDDAA